jgi:hypothetical protein
LHGQYLSDNSEIVEDSRVIDIPQVENESDIGPAEESQNGRWQLSGTVRIDVGVRNDTDGEWQVKLREDFIHDWLLPGNRNLQSESCRSWRPMIRSSCIQHNLDARETAIPGRKQRPILATGSTFVISDATGKDMAKADAPEPANERNEKTDHQAPLQPGRVLVVQISRAIGGGFVPDYRSYRSHLRL